MSKQNRWLFLWPLLVCLVLASALIAQDLLQEQRAKRLTVSEQGVPGSCSVSPGINCYANSDCRPPDCPTCDPAETCDGEQVDAEIELVTQTGSTTLLRDNNRDLLVSDSTIRINADDGIEIVTDSNPESLDLIDVFWYDGGQQQATFQLWTDGYCLCDDAPQFVFLEDVRVTQQLHLSSDDGTANLLVGRGQNNAEYNTVKWLTAGTCTTGPRQDLSCGIPQDFAVACGACRSTTVCVDDDGCTGSDWCFAGKCHRSWGCNEDTDCWTAGACSGSGAECYDDGDCPDPQTCEGEIVEDEGCTTGTCSETGYGITLNANSDEFEIDTSIRLENSAINHAVTGDTILREINTNTYNRWDSYEKSLYDLGGKQTYYGQYVFDGPASKEFEFGSVERGAALSTFYGPTVTTGVAQVEGNLEIFSGLDLMEYSGDLPSCSASVPGQLYTDQTGDLCYCSKSADDWVKLDGAGTCQ